ncbi:MAG: hypothetical protein M9885_09985 [Burkholderiaceae bacterium]|nr:hypothetical protein [Burkholderiaceae bacterium]
MHKTILAIALSLFAASALAADPSCTDRANEKKLAGAARTSFLKKCETDAKSACELQAKERKLSGAAQTSFVRKCTRDSVGAPPPADGKGAGAPKG